MPNTGVPRSNRAGSHFGAAGSDTLFGPPDKMIPTGRRARICSAGVSGRQISEWTDSSRKRRAISWVYCEPKSRTRIVWWLTKREPSLTQDEKGAEKLDAIIAVCGWGGPQDVVVLVRL